MKSVALVVVALGLLFTMATPSLAHEHWAGHGGYYGPAYHHHGYAGGYYYGGYRPVVVVPAPVYDYTYYPPAVAPVYGTVAPSPYYYGAPGVSFRLPWSGSKNRRWVLAATRLVKPENFG